MSWESILIKAKPIPKRNKAMMAIGNAVTMANATDEPAKVPEIQISNLKGTIQRMLQEIEQYQGEEFAERFKNLHWDEGDKEDLTRILNEMLQNLPDRALEEDKSYIVDKVQAFLEGDHDALLEMIGSSKYKGLKSTLKTWNRKNKNKLSEYIAANPELAEKMSSIFDVAIPIEDLKIENIESKNIDGPFLLEYLTMLLNDVKITSRQKEKYLPRATRGNARTFVLFGMEGGKNRLPKAVEYILLNETLDVGSFMTKSDIKTSTKKEVIFSRLNAGQFADGEYADLQTLYNENNNNPREFERNLSARQKRQFKKLWDEEQVSALKYAIPQNVYEMIKAGQWESMMENYQIYDPDDLDEFLKKHREALERMKLDEKLGMYKVGTREDVKELQQLFQNDGSLIPYSSMEESGGALEAYLNRLSKFDKDADENDVFDKENSLHGLTHQQTSLHSLIGTMDDIKDAYQNEISIEISDPIMDYIKNPSEENKKAVENIVSDSTYKEVRDALIDQLSTHVKKMGSEGDENLMHRKPNVIEPLQWLKDNLG